ncbi:MAG: saccharopine dehydrogenase NADP-binding domain-containing protein [Gammaproteobacteria bacterium]|nr:saccharopine dehydrogenase NADP-binding domain-containing protein [Gammaproteobacteria bacterium]
MAPPAARENRDFDVVVYGATGFTGRLVAEYLHERYGDTPEFRWAVAARKPGKLRSVMSEIGVDPGRVPQFQADSDSPSTLAELAGRARVMLTTVGPYAKYGSPLVEACVRSATDYVDLAGEVQWMRRMIDAYHENAAASGARIVHACGFDSIPSDLGVLFLQQQSLEHFGEPCKQVTLLVRAMRGGASGGTVASMLNAIEEARSDRAVARTMTDPYSLNPAGERQGPDGRDQYGVAFSDELGVWTAPFVMATINMRVVRRSNALMGHPWGRDFRYSEATIAGRGPAGWLKAASMTAGLGGFVAAASSDFLRRNLVQRLLPEPGEGPDREARENGFFNMILVGTTASGKELRARVKGNRDPGYGATSRMLAESAVCLAADDLEVPGGFWTPASALGQRLIERLQQNAGMSFELE